MARDLICPKCGKFGFASKEVFSEGPSTTFKCYHCGEWSTEPEWKTVAMLRIEVDQLRASLSPSRAEGKREGLEEGAKALDKVKEYCEHKALLADIAAADIAWSQAAYEAELAAAAIREAAQNTDGPTKDQETIIYLEADLEVAKEKLKQIEAIVDAAPELNMSNYDVDQVAELNNAMIEIWQVLQPDEGGEQI